MDRFYVIAIGQHILWLKHSTCTGSWYNMSCLRPLNARTCQVYVCGSSRWKSIVLPQDTFSIFILELLIFDRLHAEATTICTSSQSCSLISLIPVLGLDSRSWTRHELLLYLCSIDRIQVLALQRRFSRLRHSHHEATIREQAALSTVLAVRYWLNLVALEGY